MALTDTDIDRLPYRPCVGLMVLNARGEIFAGQRLDNPGNAWQMPQGGIDDGETPCEAALRELGEETGLKADTVKVLRESAVWLPYELPRTLIPRLWGGRYRGQTQRWFALAYDGPDSAIDIASGEHPEFSRWAWMNPTDLKRCIVPFKRDTYDQVFSEFEDLIS